MVTVVSRLITLHCKRNRLQRKATTALYEYGLCSLCCAKNALQLFLGQIHTDDKFSFLVLACNYQRCCSVSSNCGTEQLYCSFFYRNFVVTPNLLHNQFQNGSKVIFFDNLQLSNMWRIRFYYNDLSFSNPMSSISNGLCSVAFHLFVLFFLESTFKYHRQNQQFGCLRV